MENENIFKLILLKNPLGIVIIFVLAFIPGMFLLVTLTTSVSLKGFDTNDSDGGMNSMCIYNYDSEEIQENYKQFGLSEVETENLIDVIIENNGDPSLVLSLLKYRGETLNESNSVKLTEQIFTSYYKNQTFNAYEIVSDLAPEIINENDEYVKDDAFIVGVMNYYNTATPTLYCDSEDSEFDFDETIIIGDGLFSKPMDKPLRITSPFGYRFHPNSKDYHLHRGTDFSCTFGDNLLSVLPGVVITAKFHESWGNYVLIDHSNGIYTLYAHMSKFNTVPGANVAAGQVIGSCGSTGDSTGPHLHFEVHLNAPYGTLVDPLIYFKF